MSNSIPNQQLPIDQAILKLLQPHTAQKTNEIAKGMEELALMPAEASLQQLRNLISGVTAPAFSILIAEFLKDTTEGRAVLLIELVKLVQSESFQKGLKQFEFVVNVLLLKIIQLIRVVKKYQAIIDDYLDKKTRMN